ncbi:hypothetical protein M0R45_008729 [Rubus argutus]|uniref:Uncharacterized protein n=1 Tax=Rubus argutus TaxID=59490 RepID=A0AAW1Y4Z3_RUBAR
MRFFEGHIFHGGDDAVPIEAASVVANIRDSSGNVADVSSTRTGRKRKFEKRKGSSIDRRDIIEKEIISDGISELGENFTAERNAGVAEELIPSTGSIGGSDGIGLGGDEHGLIMGSNGGIDWVLGLKTGGVAELHGGLVAERARVRCDDWARGRAVTVMAGIVGDRWVRGLGSSMPAVAVLLCRRWFVGEDWIGLRMMIGEAMGTVVWLL